MRILGLVAALVIWASGALAHSFDVAIVLPVSEPEAEDALRGFRIATREREGHSGEESDGHLGGLDVYMLPVDAGQDIEAVLAAAAAADIVLVVGAEAVWQALRSRLASDGPPVIQPGSLPGGGNWAESGGGSFAMRFRAEFGRDATEAAAQGYNAARRIELAVRPLGGAGDGAALSAAFAASRGGIEW